MNRRLMHALAALSIVALLPAAAHAGERDERPETAVEAMAYYERDPDRWLEGPVEYVILDDEREMFEELATTEQRAEFMRWFWARRDNDADENGNAFKDGFYKRVAEANARYSDFPRGWRSDRGRIHVVLGAPDGRRPIWGPHGGAEIWTYYTVGPRARERAFGSAHGEVQVAFVKTRLRGTYQIYGGFGGPGHYPLYVTQVMQYTNLAAIADFAAPMISAE